jgi:hypothetical protein
MRSKSYAVVCLAFFLFASSRANAQEFAAAIGQVAIGRCHMEDCTFFVIEDSKPVGSTSEGTLFAVAAKSWEREYRGRGGQDEHERDIAPIKAGRRASLVTFVFCSKTKPIEFSYRESKWVAEALRPGDAAAMSGAEEYAYVFYWAACHNTISRDPLSAQLADRLGYRFKGHPESEDAAGKSRVDLQPMDLLR